MMPSERVSLQEAMDGLANLAASGGSQPSTFFSPSGSQQSNNTPFPAMPPLGQNSPAVTKLLVNG